jgi:cobalamin biosynthetic protein CobC
VTPEATLIDRAERPDTLILKSFGKFWGLAGLRLGFLIGPTPLVDRMRDMIGPWAVSGPALEIGTRALMDDEWAVQTRARLAADTARMDQIMAGKGAKLVGGTTLFRLYDVGDATAWQDRMAQHHVWTRIFPYSNRWLRLGLPAPDHWDQFEASL